MLYRIILCTEALCLDRKILDALEIGCHSIHKELRVLKLLESIRDRLVDQTSRRDHRKPALQCIFAVRFVICRGAVRLSAFRCIFFVRALYGLCRYCAECITALLLCFFCHCICLIPMKT